jgi:hypothetical protein
MLNLNRSLGNVEEVNRLESVPCPWWWSMSYKEQETGLQKHIWDCGVGHVTNIISDQGALARESLQTTQERCNGIAKRVESVEANVVTIGQVIGVGLDQLYSALNVRLTLDQIPSYAAGVADQSEERRSKVRRELPGGSPTYQGEHQPELVHGEPVDGAEHQDGHQDEHQGGAVSP